MDKNLLYSYSKKQYVSSDIINSNKAFMGFELELVEASSEDGNTDHDLQTLIDDADNINILAKYDGSVDAELVSRPYLKDELKLKLKETLNIISKNSGFWHSWDTAGNGRCGFHLHVNKPSISNIKAIYNFMLKYDDVFKKISGRKNLHYCQLDYYSMMRNYRKSNYSRYTALNNLNKTTLEFRLWRGSLNFARLCYYIDLTDALCKYSRHLNKLSLTELLFLTNNKYINELLIGDDAYSKPLKDLSFMNKFFNFKKWSINIRNLNKYKKLLEKQKELQLKQKVLTSYFNYTNNCINL